MPNDSLTDDNDSKPNESLGISAYDQFNRALSPQLSLLGPYAALEPMQLSHVGDLNMAAADGELWNLKVTTVPSELAMKSYVESALKRRELGLERPFVVRRLSDQRIVGTTRYYQISSNNRNLSIGYTWYSASAQRTAINTDVKLRLLTHAFEKAACISVQWHTHHENIRSQAAIRRLGATFEGVLRNHMILADGRIRHTHCFSMLDNEWPVSKAFLQQRLSTYT